MGGSLIETIILVLFIVALVRKVASLFRVTRMDAPASASPPSSSPFRSGHHSEMTRDPVCGMFVSAELPFQLRSGGNTLHFCSQECLEKYKDHQNVAS